MKQCLDGNAPPLLKFHQFPVRNWITPAVGVVSFRGMNAVLKAAGSFPCYKRRQ